MPLDCECDGSDQSPHKINFSASLCVVAYFVCSGPSLPLLVRSHAAQQCTVCSAHDATHIAMDCLIDPMPHPPMVQAHTLFYLRPSSASDLITNKLPIVCAYFNSALVWGLHFPGACYAQGRLYDVCTNQA